MYLYLVHDNTEHKKAKDINKIVVAKISHNEYDDDEFFCDMVDQRKAFNLISSWDHCQRSSPS